MHTALKEVNEMIEVVLHFGNIKLVIRTDGATTLLFQIKSKENAPGKKSKSS